MAASPGPAAAPGPGPDAAREALVGALRARAARGALDRGAAAWDRRDQHLGAKRRAPEGDSESDGAVELEEIRRAEERLGSGGGALVDPALLAAEPEGSEAPEGPGARDPAGAAAEILAGLQEARERLALLLPATERVLEAGGAAEGGPEARLCQLLKAKLVLASYCLAELRHRAGPGPAGAGPAGGGPAGGGPAGGGPDGGEESPCFSRLRDLDVAVERAMAALLAGAEGGGAAERRAPARRGRRRDRAGSGAGSRAGFGAGSGEGSSRDGSGASDDREAGSGRPVPGAGPVLRRARAPDSSSGSAPGPRPASGQGSPLASPEGSEGSQGSQGSGGSYGSEGSDSASLGDVDLVGALSRERRLRRAQAEQDAAELLGRTGAGPAREERASGDTAPASFEDRLQALREAGAAPRLREGGPGGQKRPQKGAGGGGAPDSDSEGSFGARAREAVPRGAGPQDAGLRGRSSRSAAPEAPGSPEPPGREKPAKVYDPNSDVLRARPGARELSARPELAAKRMATPEIVKGLPDLRRAKSKKKSTARKSIRRRYERAEGALHRLQGKPRDPEYVGYRGEKGGINTRQSKSKSLGY